MLHMRKDLAHQNRTIAIASDFRVDGAKSPEIPQKERVLGSEIAARNRKSPATFHRTLKSQCSIAFSCLGNCCDFWGPRWASQSQIAKIAAIRCAKRKEDPKNLTQRFAFWPCSPRQNSQRAQRLKKFKISLRD